MGNFNFPQPLMPNMHESVQFCLYCKNVVPHQRKKYDPPVHQKSQVSPGTLRLPDTYGSKTESVFN